MESTSLLVTLLTLYLSFFLVTQICETIIALPSSTIKP
ncbi:unnamed protein product [Cercospora beticola]|nr:unnamed protein product [Cercospora beticola]